MVTQPDVLADRYHLVGEIGRGGMADVFKAQDLTADRLVAVKVMRNGEQADPERFSAEMRILDRLSHPAIVALDDSGTTIDGRPYFVMQLIGGRSLSMWMRQDGPVDPDLAVRVGQRVAGALAHAHASGVVHRDIKPANILIEEDGTAYLTDFGVARLADATMVTRAGTTIGTAAYLAPEQLQDSAVGPGADVYSLGLVLLEAMTGRRAFGGTGVEAAMARLTRDPVVPPTLPPPWVDLLIAMTRRTPDQRPTAEEVALRLGGEQEDPVGVTEEERRDRTRPRSDDEPTRIIAGELSTGEQAGWAPPETTPPAPSAPVVPPPVAPTPAAGLPLQAPAAENPAVENLAVENPAVENLAAVASAAAETSATPGHPEQSPPAAPGPPESARQAARRRFGLTALRSRALLVGLALGIAVALLVTSGVSPRGGEVALDPVAADRAVDDAAREMLAVLDASARLQATDPGVQQDLESLGDGVVDAVNASRWLDALTVIAEMVDETEQAVALLDIDGEALDQLLLALYDLTIEIQIEGGGIEAPPTADE